MKFPTLRLVSGDSIIRLVNAISYGEGVISSDIQAHGNLESMDTDDQTPVLLPEMINNNLTTTAKGRKLDL